jgi:hypothetical protein
MGKSHQIYVVIFLMNVCLSTQWLTKEAAEWAIQEFEKLEKIRGAKTGGLDKRSAAPYISGDSISCNISTVYH